MDGHNSHVTLEVVRTVMLNGLDIVTLPSHMSHALQPLDVTCFKPFKVAYRAYRDKWTLSNKGKVPEKEDLASWVSMDLKRGLNPTNIIKGFQATGIYSFNLSTMDKRMDPSSIYLDEQTREISTSNEEEVEELELRVCKIFSRRLLWYYPNAIIIMFS